jgi:hypothetical protein
MQKFPIGQCACDRTIKLYDMDSLNDNSASLTLADIQILGH